MNSCEEGLTKVRNQPIIKNIFDERTDGMNWIYKLERKFGRFAIPNLMMYLIIFAVAGFALNLINPYFFVQYLALNPEAVMHGQIWRLFTFVLYPPDSDIFWFLLYMYLYYVMGSTLERAWGTFTFNLYMFLGIIGQVVGAMLVYLITGWSGNYSLTYVYLSLLMGYALAFPDAQLLLFFIIPIKVKWIAIFEVVMFISSFITGGIATKVMIIMSMINVIIFFVSMYGRRVRHAPRQAVRRAQFEHQTRQASPRQGVPRHRCAVCGRTELDDENLEFRYCSQCDGQYEYCMEHLYTHKHVKRDDR